MPRKAKHKPLTDLQLVILSTAAGREDRSPLPWPKSLKSSEIATRDAAVTALIKRGLLKEVHAPSKSSTWRRDNAGNAKALLLTEDGLAALAPTPAETKPATEKTSTKTKRNGTKAETIVGLLRSPAGASIAELMSATGWQAHSIRGFLSGTVAKRLGHTVHSAKAEGGERRYHVEA